MNSWTSARRAAAALGVVALTTFGYATFAGAEPADNRRVEAAPQTPPPGMARMHELMVTGNLGMQRMHEQSLEGNPRMAGMHELMVTGNLGMQRMHEQSLEGNPGMQRMHELMR